MVFRKEVTVSTNLDARAGGPGDVFVAEYQTNGRGRLDHRWHSAKSENLTFSIVLAGSGRSPAEIATLPLVVGLATATALERSGFAGISIKWPNDVLVAGRKLCGILCERAGENVIAGVGVNVNQMTFPPDIADRATSLALLAGHPVDREALLQTLLAAVASCHARWLAGGFASLWPEFAAYDALSGRVVRVNATDDDSEPISGVCAGIQTDGSLLVGGVYVYAGEAHVRMESV